jgi:hypothetical protein
MSPEISAKKTAGRAAVSTGFATHSTNEGIGRDAQKAQERHHILTRGCDNDSGALFL